MSDKLTNMTVRAFTGVLFVTIMVTCFFQPVAMVFLFALITCLSLWEYSGLVNNIEDVTINRFISTVAGVYLFLAISAINSGFVQTNAVFMPYLLTIIYLFVSELYTKNKNAIHDLSYTMLGQMYVALPLSMINVLAFRTATDGNIHFYYLLPLSVFIFLWTSDTGAYCVGSFFGKHKLFPRISPAKSWEGSIGGGVLVLVAAFLVSLLDQNHGNLSGPNTLKWLDLGLVVTVFGTWGDLVESLIKRTLGIKDSGTILPGHGGMLDRFDSSLLAIPASAVYIYTIQTLV